MDKDAKIFEKQESLQIKLEALASTMKVCPLNPLMFPLLTEWMTAAHEEFDELNKLYQEKREKEVVAKTGKKPVKKVK